MGRLSQSWYRETRAQFENRFYSWLQRAISILEMKVYMSKAENVCTCADVNYHENTAKI